MNEERNEPYDSIDAYLGRALEVLPWVFVGMAMTAVLVFIGKHF